MQPNSRNENLRTSNYDGHDKKKVQITARLLIITTA